MKRWMILLLTLCLTALLCLPVSADSDLDELETGAHAYVVDEYGLLSASEEASLNATIEKIVATYDFDVVILTVYDMDGYAPESFTKAFYNLEGYKEDGVLFMLSMADRDWWVYPSGYGETVFTQYGIRYIGEEIVPTYFSKGNYAAGFEKCLEVTDDFLKAAYEGKPYDTNHLYKNFGGRSLSFKKVLICWGAAIVIALIVVTVMKKKMKTVYLQPKAGTYVKDGSFILSQSSDVFLYSTVTRTRRESNSSGGGGGIRFASSGSSHGGGGGKF